MKFSKQDLIDGLDDDGPCGKTVHTEETGKRRWSQDLDACLAEVQGERSEVKAIISRARQWITDGEVSTLLSYIEDLQRDEARNRNAIKMHLETIAARDARIRELEPLISCCNEYLKDGETPAQGIARNRQDVMIVMSQWTKALAERDTARDCLLQAQNSAIEISEKLSAAEARERGLRARIFEALELVDQFETSTMTSWPTTKRITKILQEALAAQPAAVEQQSSSSRTPEQYAIEHGRYLATAAREFMDSCNNVWAAQQAVDEDETDTQNEADGLLNRLDEAKESQSECWRGLENAIYEFTKRADRAYPLKQPSATGDGVADGQQP